MSIFDDLPKDMLYVRSTTGVLEAVESANERLSNSADTLSELLAALMDRVADWEADIDNGRRKPSHDDNEDFVNILKDAVEDWIADNR